MATKNYPYPAPRGTERALDARHGGSGINPAREHYFNNIDNARIELSRRAKSLLQLLEGQLPGNVMYILTWELATESRRDQNMLAQQLFNCLINSAQFRLPEDERLMRKLDELAGMVCEHADLKEDEDYGN